MPRGKGKGHSRTFRSACCANDRSLNTPGRLKGWSWSGVTGPHSLWGTGLSWIKKGERCQAVKGCPLSDHAKEFKHQNIVTESGRLGGDCWSGKTCMHTQSKISFITQSEIMDKYFSGNILGRTKKKKKNQCFIYDKIQKNNGSSKNYHT